MADSGATDLMRLVARILPGRTVPNAVNGVAQVLLSGQATLVRRFYFVVKSGQASVAEGTHPEPDVTVRLEVSDLEAIIAGELSAASAYMSGRVKVDGEHSLLIDGWRPIAEAQELHDALGALR